jgi:hypothetical protein
VEDLVEKLHVLVMQDIEIVSDKFLDCRIGLFEIHTLSLEPSALETTREI